MIGRVLVGAVGVLTGLYGGWLLVTRNSDDLIAIVVWLGSGVLLHDGVLMPLTLLILLLGSRLLPHWLRPSATVGLVVLGTVTVTAIPVLGRFGALPDNPTLLDRPYVTGWVVLALAVAVGVAVHALRRRAVHCRSSGAVS